MTTPFVSQLINRARQLEQQARWADGPAWSQDQREAERLRAQARRLAGAEPVMTADSEALSAQLATARAERRARLAEIAALGHKATLN